MAESDFSRLCIIGYGSSPSRCGPAAIAERSIARSPGSRARSVCTCQVLRPRRVVRTLRWRVRNVLPSALETASAPGSKLSRLNGWPMPSPTDASSPSSRNANARLGADVDRYSFIVVDLHHLLLAGLPAHFESYMLSQAVRSPPANISQATTCGRRTGGPGPTAEFQHQTVSDPPPLICFRRRIPMQMP